MIYDIASTNGDPMPERMDISLSITKKDTSSIYDDKAPQMVKTIFLEKEFCIKYQHYCTRQGRRPKRAISRPNADPHFKLVFALTAHTVVKDKAAYPGPASKNAAVLYWDSYFDTNGIQFDGPVTNIIFVFTKRWLDNNFSEASKKLTTYIDLLKSRDEHTFVSEVMDQQHHSFVREIASQMKSDKLPLMYIKIKSLIILNDFFNKLTGRSIPNITNGQALHYVEIKKVEEKLKEYLEKPMPGIAQLAIEFNISQSTLKRHFKMIFGKSIYHYHLEKKIAFGKSMLVEKNKTISEVAYTLGYNKINSFSKAFKKQYGVLPKDLGLMENIY